MITFERTTDLEQVRQVMTHPRIWPWISDDGSPAAEDFRPVNSPAIWYIAAKYRDELLGIFVFTPQNTVCWEVHTCLLPRAWGPMGLAAAKELARWMWAHTSCRRITTHVPADNLLALAFARHAGMETFGVNKRSFLRGGMLIDQTVLGISPG